MSSEEKIRELTARVEKLEKAENLRTIRKRIDMVISLVKIGVFIVLIVMAYNYIKPYKEKIDNVSKKVDTVEKYINDKFSGFKSYFAK